MARLSRRFGDFDLAEEAVQHAVAEALTAVAPRRPADHPAAWLQTAASRNALDGVRRRGRQRALAGRAGSHARRGAPAPTSGWRCSFACCHPALAPEARLALTLRAVVGLTTPQIARAFLVNETTLAQRIVRAKRKIVAAGISLTVPARPADRAARRRPGRRLRDVQRGLRLLHRGHPGPRPGRRRGVARRRRRDLAAPRARGLGTGRAAHDPARPGRRPVRRARRAGAAARPGPPALGRHGDRRGETGSSSGPRRCADPAATSSRRRSPPCTRPHRRGRRPTGSRS